MLDLGDEAIAALTRNGDRNLWRAMQEFMKFLNEREKAGNGNEPATEKQLDYLKEVLGENGYRKLDGLNLTRDQVSELIKYGREKGNRVFVLPDKDQRDAFLEWLDYNSIETPTIEGLDTVILLDQKALDVLVSGMKELNEKLAEHNINLEELDLDQEDLGIDARDIEALQRDLQQVQRQEQAQQRDPVKGPEEKTTPEREMNTKEQDLTARVVEDPIKSHDGMDIDTRSAVVETTGYQWKQDIADRVAQAREAAISEEDFEQKCAERGIQLDRATDGEYLYRDAETPWHNIRGDSLGEQFSRNSFEKPSLSSRVMAAEQASKGLAADRDVPGLEHSVMSR